MADITSTIQKYKYPRTPHLPYSPGGTEDDIRISDVSDFQYRQVVVTEKMDGESVTLYPDGFFHARSLDSAYHESRDWLARWHRQGISPNIPKGWRICGEYLRATHSIYYAKLPTYFQVISIWDETNTCLAWSDTAVWCKLLGLETVPVWYIGEYNEKMFKTSFPLKESTGPEVEGYVIRVFHSFRYENFLHSVAKWVRKSHVPVGTPHWSRGPLRLNTLHQ